MRPRGEVFEAMRTAALAGPGTVTELAHRGQVGLPVARYTASRMLARGDLVPVSSGRPMVLAVPDVAPEPAAPPPLPAWMAALDAQWAANRQAHAQRPVLSFADL